MIVPLRITRRDSLRILAAAAGATAASRFGLGHTLFAAEPTTSKSPIMTRNIPSTGEALPVIGLGTWQTFDVGSSSADRAPLEEVLAAFVTEGGKLIDSSPMYRNSEEVVGDLAAKLDTRSKLFVATKVWTSGKQQGIEQMEDSMAKLRADPIDLMQVHNLVDVETQLATLKEWKAAGRVRYIGVTHYTASGHSAVVKIMEKHPLDFVQINYSVGEREAEKGVLPAAKERGIAVIANRPFAGGDLFSRLRSKSLPDWAAEIDCTSWAQILLKFVVSHPTMTCAIPATSKVKHLRDNMVAAHGRLPDKELRARIAAEAA